MQYTFLQLEYVNQLQEDSAAEALFVFVNETRLHEIPTYRGKENVFHLSDIYHVFS